MGPTSSRSSPRRASATAGRRRSQEQLDAACGEARAQGLRSMVPRAQPRVDDARRPRQLHGRGARRRDAGSLPAAGRAWRLVRPEHRIVTQNYLENKPRFLGVGNYTKKASRRWKRRWR